MVETFKKRDLKISVVIPCYNEEDSIETTIKEISEVFNFAGIIYEILVINDGSTDNTLKILKKIENNYDNVRVFCHDFNFGYGASLKTGIKNSRFDIIGITDSDGTYPHKEFQEFIKYIEDYDMVVGIRTGKKSKIPLLRKPAKWFLNHFASFIVRRKIRDVNSGMRLFKKELALKYWRLFPDGFSFTTTLTLSSIMGKHRIKEIEIDYFKRKGKSKIKPLSDTYNFFLIILRMAMMFNPLRIFVPLFIFFMFLTLVSIGRDIYNLNLSDTTVILFIFSFLTLMIGLIADMLIRLWGFFDK